MKNKRLLFMILALALMCVALSACDFLGGILPGGSSTTTTTATDPVTTTAPPPTSSVTTTEPAPSLETAELEFESDTFTYDGQAKSIAVDGLPEGATVLYYINGSTTPVETVALTNAGTYAVKAVVALPEGYEPCEDLEATLTINKADLTLNIGFEDDTVIENGAAQTIAYTGTLPEGVTATYVYRKSGKPVAAAEVVAPGEYTVMLVFGLSDDLKANYNVPTGLSAKLTIEAKKDYDLTGVTLAGATTITYGQATPSFTLGGLPTGLAQGETVITDQDGETVTGKLDAGLYNVTIAYVNNDAVAYNNPTVAYSFELTVDPAEIPGWSAVEFKDGQGKVLPDTFYTIAVEGLGDLDVAVAVKYYLVAEDGTETEIPATSYSEKGVYSIIAKFTVADKNYKTPDDMRATLTITEKEVYILDGVTLIGDKTIVYGTATPNFKLENLPEGLDQGAITINGEAVPSGFLGFGTYDVVIEFVNLNTKEYMDPAPYTFTLTVNKAYIAGWNVVFEDVTKTYTGAAITLAVSDYTGFPVTVTYYLVAEDGTRTEIDAASYSDVGVYKVVAVFTVTDDNYNTPAELTATLTINEKKTYTYDDVTVNGATEITYGDDTPDFTLEGLHGNLTVDTVTITNEIGETVTGKLNAGKYTVTFTFTHEDEDEEEYNDPAPYTFTLTVKHIEGTLPEDIEIVWDYDAQKADDGDYIECAAGKTYTVQLTEETVAALNAAGIEVGGYTGNTASGVGTYTATAILLSKDGNTVYPAKELTWKLQSPSWTNPEGPEI